MNWTIREATEADAEKIVGFLNTMAQEPDLRVILRTGQSVDNERTFIRHYDEQQNSAIFIAEHDGEIIGYARATGSLSPYACHVVELGNMAILKAYRGQGVGTALMKYALAWAEANPIIERLRLEVSADSERAIQFFSRFGFQLESVHERSYLINGVFYDSLVMMKLVADVAALRAAPDMAQISRRLVDALSAS